MVLRTLLIPKRQKGVEKRRRTSQHKSNEGEERKNTGSNNCINIRCSRSRFIYSSHIIHCLGRTFDFLPRKSQRPYLWWAMIEIECIKGAFSSTSSCLSLCVLFGYTVVFGFPNCCIWISKFYYLPKLLLGWVTTRSLSLRRFVALPKIVQDRLSTTPPPG